MTIPTKNELNRALCYTSSGYALNRNITSTGFRIESALMQNDSVDEIAEIYLLNSSIDTTNIETVYTINKYLKYPLTEVTALSSHTVHSGLKRVNLEKSLSLDMSLDEIIKRRKTSRKYTGDSVPSNYLSTVLRVCNGVTHEVKESNFVRQQRTCPSGGGLYPVKIYVLANKVRKLAKGIYSYDPLKDALFVIEDKADEITDFLKSQSISELPNIKDCSFILFFTIEEWKSVSKYGSTGLRFACIEMGEISQNVHIAATALGMGTCAYASFSSQMVNKLLRIDGDFECFQHAILSGINSGN